MVAPLDGGLYANLMRSADLVSQQVASTVLNATLRARDTACNETRIASAHAVTSSCNGDLWVQYSGSSDSLRGSYGLDSTAFGLQAGFDHAVADNVHLGVEAGFNRINGSDRDGGNGSVDAAHGGVYAYANAGQVVFSGLLDLAHEHYGVYRQTGIGHGVAHPDGQATAAAIQAAWPIATAHWQITPAIGMQYRHQSLDAFGETIPSSDPLAGAFALHGSRSTYSTLQPYALLSLARPFTALGVGYVPQFSVGYRYDTRSMNTPQVRTTSQDGTAFMLSGDPLGRGTAIVGMRLTAQAGATWSLYLDYQGQFSSRLNDNAMSAGFIKRF